MHRHIVNGYLRWLLLAAGLVVGCQREPPSPPPISVKVKELGLERVTSATRFSATVQPRQTVELAFKVPGTVEHLYRVDSPEGPRDVQEGDVLQAGDVIAELDRQDYTRQRDRARAELAAATERVRRAEASHEFAQREHERTERLRQDGSVSQKEIDDARSQLDIAFAEVQTAVQTQTAATIALTQAEDRLEDCTLRVPIDSATVVQKSVEPQERIREGQTVFTTMDVSTVHVEFGAPETLLGVVAAGDDRSRLAGGQELKVSLDAFEGRAFSGRVTKIAPAADPSTRTFPVEVTLDNSEGLIRPGMIATVSVGEEREAVLLPMTAIQRGQHPGEMVVYVIEERREQSFTRRRRVELGGVYNNQIEIKVDSSDVYLGDRVAVTGAWRLEDGAVVRVLPRDPGEIQP